MNPEQQLIRQWLAAPAAGPLSVIASPMATALGLRICQVNLDMQQIEIDFTPGPQFLQGAGVVQGGAVAAMLDFAMAYAALAVVPDGKSVATAALNVSFLRAAQQGRFTAIGVVDRAGRSMVFASARLSDAAGKLVATASSNLPIVG